jgi:hypothetical protein
VGLAAGCSNIQTIQEKKMKPRTHIALAMIIFAGLSLSPVRSFGIGVGDKAPAFSGESTHGSIRLADFAGKQNVILALYFAIFTPV